ncbi:hypothetical protein DPMN_113493 [Dreissena polymorpha]|uniref:Uncharacterized protein n=1 Tax=Dreissena polymorpha TaxID=45954 RepID=A0A9D4KI19_DREPO|nr:hypothetical protein DPMN_113493 [Dreissena polymorpha]
MELHILSGERAWCNGETTKNGIEMADVFFIDYGNKALIPKCEVLCTQGFWTMPPMASPFKLSAPDLELPSMVNQVVTVQVVEPGIHQTNFVFRRKKLVIRLANAGWLAGWLAGWRAGGTSLIMKLHR